MQRDVDWTGKLADGIVMSSAEHMGTFNMTERAVSRKNSVKRIVKLHQAQMLVWLPILVRMVASINVHTSLAERRSKRPDFMTTQWQSNLGLFVSIDNGTRFGSRYRYVQSSPFTKHSRIVVLQDTFKSG